MRRATRAGGKLPEDPDTVLFDAFLRIAYNIKIENIVEDLLVNSDQTQMVLAQGGTISYAPVGSKQVATCGMDEKRAVTVLVSLTNSGVLLPFQTIYKGSSARSLPEPDSPHYQDALGKGFLFNVSNTSTYWSTIETMKKFVDETLTPYFDRIVEEKNLPADQHRIWYIDSWSVHRSDEFLSWMALNHPLIIVIFVPARMTGFFQPCDVGFQRIFKHSLKQSAHEDVVKEVLAKFQKGTKPEAVSLDTTIKVLRNRTPRWLWVAYNKLNKPDIIKKVSMTWAPGQWKTYVVVIRLGSCAE
ncbi:hypothetical protein BDN72DRAFT_780690 [Pluteus cervinus]|uniref:Uncharacterized protein n=1 Tax=Pluteus cervinus TaxID=181527 RepID=A0ACD3A182_9AGAR|nr:hypothetical protein BDN72DRAFT_780690 [Pluteus cervinus]